MSALYDDLLDAGDRLVAAVAAGDLGGAAEALADRAGLLGQAAPGARPAADAVERFRQQDRALGVVLRDQLLAHAATAATAGRMAAATKGYAARPARPARLDTVPR